MKILVADDESRKIENISEFIAEKFPNFSLLTSRSVKSTISSIVEGAFDLIILDMSLPTFDIAPGEPGGRAQGSGGIEVLRNMDFHEIETPVIVVTQYETVPERGMLVPLKAIEERLYKEHPGTFRGCVFFGALNDTWRPILLEKVESILKGK
jgi:CheY-like chemotaxis protein